MIDFTSSAWSGAEGQSTFKRTYGALEVTLSASGAMTVNASDAPNAGASSSLAFAGDGIGIRDDEVSWLGGEHVDVLFSSEVTVLGYYFLDFFGGEAPGGLMGERATVLFDSGSLQDEASLVDSIGFYERNGLSLATQKLSFSAGGLVGPTLLTQLDGFDLPGFDWFSDFALAGVMIDDGTSIRVPEPSSLALLAIGLLSFEWLRRAGPGVSRPPSGWPRASKTPSKSAFP